VQQNMSKLLQENVIYDQDINAFPEGEGLLVNNSILGGINKPFQSNNSNVDVLADMVPKKKKSSKKQSEDSKSKRSSKRLNDSKSRFSSNSKKSAVSKRSDSKSKKSVASKPKKAPKASPREKSSNKTPSKSKDKRIAAQVKKKK